MEDPHQWILMDVATFFATGFGFGTTLFWLGVAFRSFYDLSKEGDR